LVVVVVVVVVVVQVDKEHADEHEGVREGDRPRAVVWSRPSARRRGVVVLDS
jgi:hypothetical protein